MSGYRKKLIEVALPLDAINKESAREKSIRHGHPSTLHLWWARRPLATCRAVLFGQLVDDPSAWPELFPTEADQDRERQRLFRLIEELVKWENSNNDGVLDAARLEIARSLARGRVAEGDGDRRDEEVLEEGATAEVVRAYLAEGAPPVHDPFAGGGSIPLEAQRLGLRAIATDLNPVAVMICKALIEIPPKFAGRAPVGPLPEGEKQKRLGTEHWPGATGLAEDVRRYGAWMRQEAFKRIGHLYPKVDLPAEHGGGKATVIAWLWARTVESPNPAFRGVHVPLVRSFTLSTKKKDKVWVEAVFSDDRQSYQFELRAGAGEPEIRGSISRTGGTCLASGDPIPLSYVRDEAKHGKMAVRLLAVVAENKNKRIYLAPTVEIEQVAAVAIPEDVPNTHLPEHALGFRVQRYGMTMHTHLFTPRQVTTFMTYSDLVCDMHEKVVAAATTCGWAADERCIDDGGTGAMAYGDALATYLTFAISKLADYNSSLVVWSPTRDQAKTTFGRQALPMVWDYSEVNPFAEAAGDLCVSCAGIAKTLARLEATNDGISQQGAVQKLTTNERYLFSTDPPYFDNVPYADLSDYFYVWMRRSLQLIFPDLFRTMLVPKDDELIAEPFRHGGKLGAANFFLTGMSVALSQIARATFPGFPVAVYYAFKQSETDSSGTASTGWETFLEAVIEAGFSVVGTWPIRTEREARSRSIGSNALASSVVLVCRQRSDRATIVSKADFRRLLKQELPQGLVLLQKGNIAPVDMAQASIGPGMAIFSRHAKVLEADGTPMSVRSALQLIHQITDEIRGEEEGDFDRDTRFAVTWFESHAFEEGPYGEAEVLATARGVAVSGVAHAGLLQSGAGKVRLYTRAELPKTWNPEKDERATVWEATQHLIKRLDEEGEAATASLLAKLGPTAEHARNLAYRLYTTCERKGWAEEARAYNGLVLAWPELQKLAGQMEAGAGPADQVKLFD